MAFQTSEMSTKILQDQDKTMTRTELNIIHMDQENL
jgi:hypothetical protein